MHPGHLAPLPPVRHLFQGHRRKTAALDVSKDDRKDVVGHRAEYLRVAVDMRWSTGGHLLLHDREVMGTHRRSRHRRQPMLAGVHDGTFR